MRGAERGVDGEGSGGGRGRLGLIPLHDQGLALEVTCTLGYLQNTDGVNV